MGIYMRFFYLISIMAFYAGCSPSNHSRLNIVGGEPTTNPGFFASIHHIGDEFSFCGASFIDEMILVTAAHCVAFNHTSLGVVARGSFIGDPQGETIPVIEVLVHPEWDGVTVKNDIALLFLSRSPARVSIIPIAITDDISLPESNPEMPLQALGYGDVSTDGTWASRDLASIFLRVLPLASCQGIGPDYAGVGPTQLCTDPSPQPARDSCFGDSGGPLFGVDVVTGRPLLLGLISWGRGCAQKDSPGVLTRVGAYAEWIHSAIDFQVGMDKESHVVASCYQGVYDTVRYSFGTSSLEYSALLRLEPWPGKDPAAPVFNPVPLKSCGTGDTAVSLVRDNYSVARSQKPQYAVQPTKGTLRIERQLIMRCKNALGQSLAFGMDEDPNGAVWATIDGVEQFASRLQNFPDETAETAACLFSGNSVRWRSSKAGEIFVSAQWAGDSPARAYFKLTPIFKEAGFSATALASDSLNLFRLRLTNASSKDVYTWKISCDRDFWLTENSGFIYEAIANDQNFTVNFLHPDSPWSHLAPYDSQEWLLEFKDAESISGTSCQLNGNSEWFRWESAPTFKRKV